jgi:hypothetical protein
MIDGIAGFPYPWSSAIVYFVFLLAGKRSKSKRAIVSMNRQSELFHVQGIVRQERAKKIRRI